MNCDGALYLVTFVVYGGSLDLKEIRDLYQLQSWNSCPGSPCRLCLVETSKVNNNNGRPFVSVPLNTGTGLRGKSGNSSFEDSRHLRNGFKGLRFG